MCVVHDQPERSDDHDVQTPRLLQGMRTPLLHEEPPEKGVPHLQERIQKDLLRPLLLNKSH